MAHTVSRLKSHRAGFGWTGQKGESKATDKYNTFVGILQQCWEELSKQYFISIVERMPWVCSAIISAKGGDFDESKI